MNPKAIHETILNTLVTGMSSAQSYVKDAIDKSDSMKAKKSRNNQIARANSIARASTGLTFTYPTLCSTSLEISECTMVGGALERRNVTMLQMLLAANQWTKENIMDYLKDFHTNLDYNKMDIYDVINILNDGIPKNESQINNVLLNMIPIREKTETLQDFRQNTNYFFEDDINESNINRFVSVDVNGYNTIMEAGKGKPNPKPKPNTPKDNKPKDSKPNTPKYDTKSDINPEIPAKPNKPEEKVDDKPKDNSISLSLSNGLPNDYGTTTIANKINDYGVTDRLISSEVKKANEMVPSLMLVNTIDPSTGVNMQCVIGVKSRIVAVPSSEVIGRIIANYQDSNFMLKLVKLTTREISFFKDFLFAIDSAKLDAINNSKKGSSSSLFRALERRSQNGKIRKLAGSKQLDKAICSLVISQDDVEELKKEHNIDVEIPRIIKPIMERLCLLYFVIVDPSSQSVKIFIDGADDYELYTYDALKKESKDDSYKKVINLMTKMTN